MYVNAVKYNYFVWLKLFCLVEWMYYKTSLQHASKTKRCYLIRSYNAIDGGTTNSSIFGKARCQAERSVILLHNNKVLSTWLGLICIVVTINIRHIPNIATFKLKLTNFLWSVEINCPDINKIFIKVSFLHPNLPPAK